MNLSRPVQNTRIKVNEDIMRICLSMAIHTNTLSRNTSHKNTSNDKPFDLNIPFQIQVGIFQANLREVTNASDKDRTMLLEHIVLDIVSTSKTTDDLVDNQIIGEVQVSTKIGNIKNEQIQAFNIDFNLVFYCNETQMVEQLNAILDSVTILVGFSSIDWVALLCGEKKYDSTSSVFNLLFFT